MGNSYMDWEEKGKGFLWLSGHGDWGYDFRLIRAVAQSGSALPWGGRGPGLAPSDLPPPILVSRSTMEWICASHGNWPPQTYPRPFSTVAPRRDRCPLTRGNSNPGASSSFRAAGKAAMILSSNGP